MALNTVDFPAPLGPITQDDFSLIHLEVDLGDHVVSRVVAGADPTEFQQGMVSGGHPDTSAPAPK